MPARAFQETSPVVLGSGTVSCWPALSLTVALGAMAPASALARPFPNLTLVPSSKLEPAPWAESLTKTATHLDERFEGRFAAYVSDPYRGYRWGYNDDVPYYLASGVKIAFMVEVFRQREKGTLSLDEQVPYDAEAIRDGAPRVNRLRLGSTVSVGTLLDYMMRSSDNSASDMLARRVGLRNVNLGLEEAGIFGFTPLTFLLDVRRGIYRELDVTADDLTAEDVRAIRWTRIWDPQLRKLEQMLGKPPGYYTRQDLFDAYDRFYATGVNRAPMRAVGFLFEEMAQGRLVSEKASDDMVALMSEARTSTHRLMGKLPAGTRVAHKTGSQFLKVCDLGLIFLPDDTPLVVTICTDGGEVPAAEGAIAALARAAYDLAVAEHRQAKATAAQGAQ